MSSRFLSGWSGVQITLGALRFFKKPRYLPRLPAASDIASWRYFRLAKLQLQLQTDLRPPSGCALGGDSLGLRSDVVESGRLARGGFELSKRTTPARSTSSPRATPLLCLLLLSTACAADPALWSCATLLAVGTAVAIASWCRYVWRIDAELAAALEEMGYRGQAERRAARIPRWLRARYLARARRAADAAVSP